ncbi:MAG: hypothetical protein R3F34_01905 [Planctomycetota bacterium]
MYAVVAIVAFVAGTACAAWVLRLRLRAVGTPTREELLAPVNVLVCLQAWIGGAGIASLAGTEVYGATATADEVTNVTRAAVGALFAWLPIALGLVVPMLRSLRNSRPEIFVDVSSALVYSVALVSWLGSGRWSDAF